VSTVRQVHRPDFGVVAGGRHDSPARPQGIALLPAVRDGGADRRERPAMNDSVGACDGCGALVYPGDGHKDTEGWAMSLGETVDVTFCKTCLDGEDDV
jgi:hypothetical protein